jgi:hypothetical protein
MELIDELEEEIEKLKDNNYGLMVMKAKSKGVITVSIIIPEEILNKEISEMSIEFQLILDTNTLKLVPRLYCLSAYCFPHFADGRDLFNELRSSKNQKQNFSLLNLLSDILEFIRINYENGGLYFFGNYYLGAKYSLRLLQKGCENILNVKENLVLNGKSVKLNRVLVISDVYFLLFEQEKWYKNNLNLLFWSSISNIEKIQKVKDNKTIILQWIQKEKETYPMTLTLQHREAFIQNLLEKMHHFGMVYDVIKMDNKGSKKFRKGDNISQSQNVKLINDYNRQELQKNEEEEGEEEYEEDEEEEDDEDANEKETDETKDTRVIRKNNDKSEKTDNADNINNINNIDNINSNNDKKGENKIEDLKESNEVINKKENKNEETKKEDVDEDDFVEAEIVDNNNKGQEKEEIININKNEDNPNKEKESKEEIKEPEKKENPENNIESTNINDKIEDKKEEEKKEEDKKEEEKKEEENKEVENKEEENKE